MLCPYGCYLLSSIQGYNVVWLLVAIRNRTCGQGHKRPRLKETEFLETHLSVSLRQLQVSLSRPRISSPVNDIIFPDLFHWGFLLCPEFKIGFYFMGLICRNPLNGNRFTINGSSSVFLISTDYTWKGIKRKDSNSSWPENLTAQTKNDFFCPELMVFFLERY